MESEGGQPAAGSIVHKLAKPATRGLAWTSVALAAVALGLASRRNLQGH